MRKLISMTAAAALALAALAPSAQAQDRRGYHDHDRGGYGYGDGRDYDDYYRGYDNRGYYDRRRHRDNDDAIAAGVIGLVLGLALGAAATSQPRQPQARCYDNYQRCDPPQGYYRGGRQYDEGSAYERDYGPQRPQCTRRERQWDRYANRYVTVDVPC